MEFQVGDRVIYIGPIDKINGKIGTVNSYDYTGTPYIGVTFFGDENHKEPLPYAILRTNLIMAESLNISVDVSEFL